MVGRCVITLSNVLNPLAIKIAVEAFKAGKLEVARRLVLDALLVDDSQADALALLGAIFCADKNFAAALPLFQRAVELDPANAQFQYNLAVTYFELVLWDAALLCYQQVLALSPGHIPALSNHGDLLRRFDRPLEALQNYEVVLALDAKTKGLNLRLAVTHAELHNDAQAERYFILALAQADAGQLPKGIDKSTDYAQASWEYAHFLLLKKRFSEGWAAYEYRSKCAFPTAVPHFPYPQPQWNGEALNGRTLLVFREQGLGDEIMFGTLMVEVAALAGRLVIVASPGLTRLWQSTFAALNRQTDRVQVLADWYPEAPHWLTPARPDWLATAQIDFQCSMGRLAFLLRPTVGSFSNPQASLLVDESLLARWRERLAQPGGQNGPLRVGVMWQANPQRHSFDGNRRSVRKSVPLQLLSRLNSRPARIQLVSLANREHADQLNMPQAPDLADFSECLADLAETAALMKNLDLIITVDTSLAHLAGALGLEVWLLLAFTADWRWGEADDTSYWYKNVRLFRQPRQGDWATLIEAVAAQLAHWADSR